MEDVRNLAFFVSDVHLGLDCKDPEDRERRFVSFLKGIPKEKTSALYMLGDIWDFWYEYRDVVPKGYSRVFASLHELMDAGVPVFFIPGNHDLWCYRYFEELGIKVLRQPYVTQIGGKTFCLGHGDGLGDVGAGYRFMKRIFESRFLQALFSTLHPWIAFRFGKGWSGKSRLSKNIHYEFKRESEPLYKYAVEFSSAQKIDYFIFGHYHCNADIELPTGARLLLTGDWMDGENYLYFDGITTFSGHSKNSE
ncbi:MAG: UDP-2,3-diacylglucosamine diphosphatase [Bacteroidales bacterium]|nr:UDP-2,3-diacylglucosamine diphosphatase [Bacteroidales bacterium]